MELGVISKEFPEPSAVPSTSSVSALRPLTGSSESRNLGVLNNDSGNHQSLAIPGTDHTSPHVHRHLDASQLQGVQQYHGWSQSAHGKVGVQHGEQ